MNTKHPNEPTLERLMGLHYDLLQEDPPSEETKKKIAAICLQIRIAMEREKGKGK